MNIFNFTTSSSQGTLALNTNLLETNIINLLIVGFVIARFLFPIMIGYIDSRISEIRSAYEKNDRREKNLALRKAKLAEDCEFIKYVALCEYLEHLESYPEIINKRKREILIRSIQRRKDFINETTLMVAARLENFVNEVTPLVLPALIERLKVRAKDKKFRRKFYAYAKKCLIIQVNLKRNRRIRHKRYLRQTYGDRYVELRSKNKRRFGYQQFSA